VELICRVMQVSTRGYRSWRSRPISQRARTDMKVLAHIREQYRLSLGSYGRPRMTMELKEVGLTVGERRVGRLMRINGIKPVRTRRQCQELRVRGGIMGKKETPYGTTQSPCDTG
jgi:transposase InsO family protein